MRMTVLQNSKIRVTAFGGFNRLNSFTFSWTYSTITSMRDILYSQFCFPIEFMEGNITMYE